LEEKFAETEARIKGFQDAEKSRLDTNRKNQMSLEGARKSQKIKESQLIEKGYINPDGKIPIRIAALEGLGEKIEALRSQRAQADIEAASIQNTLGDEKRNLEQLQREETSRVRELQELDNLRTRRYRMFKETGQDRDAVTAVDWLRENHSMFAGFISEPLLLGLELTDGKYAGMIETCIAWIDQKTFVIEKQEDYYKFRQLLLNERKLRVGIKCPRAKFSDFAQDIQKMKRSIPQFGFEGVLIDLVQAPEPVLAFLCEASSFHKIVFYAY
jgi:hypothetical protein